jgi:hypothetical protein
MLSIKSWMVEDLLTAYYTLFNMLHWNIYQLHRVSKFQVVMYIFNLTVICIPMQLHQSHQTRSTTLRSVIDCEYSSYLFLFVYYDIQHMYSSMYSECCLRTIYAIYSNSTTNKKYFYNYNQTYK